MGSFRYLSRTSLCARRQLGLTCVGGVLLSVSTCHRWGNLYRRGTRPSAGWPAKASAHHAQYGLSVQVVHTLEKEEREKHGNLVVLFFWSPSHHLQTPIHSWDLSPPEPPYSILFQFQTQQSWTQGETTHLTAEISFGKKRIGKTLQQIQPIINI